MKRKRVFKILWFSVNTLLLASLSVLSWALVQEYSARAYLQGFVDGIVPLDGLPEQKAEAILTWLANPPGRLTTLPQRASSSYRDPITQLHYAKLLEVCGSSVSVFISVADRAGIETRRLLLLNEKRQTVHVVAEVRLDGRWVVADPSSRTFLRDAQGHLLTKEELRAPPVFQEATQGIQGYKPEYRFDRTVHLRMGRIPFVGRTLRNGLNYLFPDWDGYPFLSLLLSRSSLVLFVISLIAFGLSLLARLALGWYGAKHWGIQRVRLRDRLRRALGAFFSSMA